MHRITATSCAAVCVLVLSAVARAELTLGAIPNSAARCTKFQVTLSTDEGHEWSRIHFTGLRLVRAWHHHFGWDQSNTPGPPIHGATAYEWSMAWKGPPTFEFEVTGDVGELATLQVSYIGGSYGVPTRYTDTEEIEIDPASPRLTLENLGSGPLEINGWDATQIRAFVGDCDVPRPNETVTITSTLGLLSEGAPSAYSLRRLEDRGYNYAREQKQTELNGIKVKSDTDGFATFYLQAHTPVIREIINARVGDTRLWNDSTPGSDHGRARTAIVRAEAYVAGFPLDESLEVSMLPGTDLGLVETLYEDAVEGSMVRWGVAAYETIRGHRLGSADEGEVTDISTLIDLLPGGHPGNYTTENYQAATLLFLDSLRRNPATAAFVDGWDWVPVKRFGLFKSVVVYQRDGGWESGWLFDPYWTGAGAVYKDLVPLGALSIDGDPRFSEQYPETSGGQYPNTYPAPREYTRSADALVVTTHSPVVPLLTTPDGKRSGIGGDGTPLGEIPGTRLDRVTLSGGGTKHHLQVDASEAELTLRGTGEGTCSVTVTRLGEKGEPVGAEWQELPVSPGAIITIGLEPDCVFVPAVLETGPARWPVGSESLTKIRLKVKLRDPVKRPGRDALSLRARWRNGDAPFDVTGDDVHVAIGALALTLPSTQVRVSKRGKLTYRSARGAPGPKIRFSYVPQNGKLRLKVVRADLSTHGFEPGRISVRCVCAPRGAERIVTLVQRRRSLVAR